MPYPYPFYPFSGHPYRPGYEPGYGPDYPEPEPPKKSGAQKK
jgi:hypothetical protein